MYGRVLQMVFCLLLSVLVARGQDVLKLLNRDSWSFSTNEVQHLNALSPQVMQPTVVGIVSSVTEYGDNDRLLAFRVIDLNGDGADELLARLDCSGRGIVQDLVVLSRKGGAYICDTVSAYGQDITVYQSGTQFLIVASCRLLGEDVNHADPNQDFQFLYAWSGTNCNDVSRQHREYYESRFVPSLTNAIARYDERIGADKDDQRRSFLEVFGFGMAAQKFTELFSVSPLSREQTKKLERLLSRLSADQDTKLKKQLGDEFRKVEAYLQNQLNR